MSSRIFGLVVALALAGLAACERQPVVTADAGWTILVEARDGPGKPLAASELATDTVLEALHPGSGRSVPLSAGLAAVGRPALSPDGSRVAFVGRREGDDHDRLFVSDVDGSRREEVVTGLTSVRSPDFLADGALVVSAIGSGPDSAGGRQLFAVGGSRAQPEQLTFGTDAARDPAALPDGRILYVAARRDGGSDGLLTVHADGTGVGTYAEFEGGPWRLRQPRPRADGSFTVRAFTAAAGSPAGEVLLEIDPDLAAPHGVHEVAAREAARADDPTPPAGRRYRTLLPVVTRLAPARHLSLVDPTKATGELFAIDVRRSRIPLARDAEPGTLASLRFLHAAGPGQDVPLGEATIHEDGSFFVEVPADTPLLLEMLDRDGRVVARQNHPFWVRAGERRACIGCHESRLSAAPNRAPLAVSLDSERIPARSWSRGENAE